MPYNIYRADGAAVTVPDSTTNDTFCDLSANGNHGLGIRLVGRNKVDYGADIAQNFLQLMANFAGPTMPSDATAQQGQLWFKTDTTTLYVRFGPTFAGGGMANWRIVGAGSTPAVGGELRNAITNALIGYTTISIPSGESPSAYVALISSDAIPMGWLRLTPGGGMTTEIANYLNVVIGYAFPPV